MESSITSKIHDQVALFVELYDVAPNAIILDVDHSTELFAAMLLTPTKNRVPGARPNTIFGLRVINGNTDEPIVCLVR